VVERVVRFAEQLAVRLAPVERRVVLAGHEAHILDVQLADDLLELGEAAAALLRVVGRVREIAGEHDEIGLLGKRVHRGHRLAQRPLRVRVRRPLEAPVGVGHLHEVEVVHVVGPRGRHGPVRRIAECHAATSRGREPRREHHAAEARQFQEFPSIHRTTHRCLLSGWKNEQVRRALPPSPKRNSG
jgi:hypothetical protein